MPWKEESVMCQRLALVEQMLLPGANISKLCARYGISRKTAYKWLERYQNGGPPALEDQSREPDKQPKKVSRQVEQSVLEAHRQYPHWGPFKLKHYLLNEGILDPPPSHPTIHRILERNDCKVIKSHLSHPAHTRFERDQPNALWQMDFKGSFMTQKQRCYPLTILDDCSRFSLAIRACANEQCITVKEYLTRVFKEFGLPDQMNVDNGNPWGSADLESLTSLQVWLMKHGVMLTHSAPYHPQTNGKIERFHRAFKLEVLHQKEYRDHEEAQSAFDHWRHIYNFSRPHQAIGNQTPSSRYHASPRAFTEQVSYEYEPGEVVKKVSTGKGLFHFKGQYHSAGKAFGGEYIAIKETEDTEVFAMYFMDRFIKKFSLEKRP